ncbi:hypothetical protein M3P05_15385 [Sansalvadorimonas sp. 2012CJ34-2]|uniref:Uncharacterized protein n=1 Tax=Parendozoicomonas callyspongiae TaxID=2942213 RepID=A0ABT0PJ91_9GAMM|nr:hypothetical protein [Sansalvadorimonas sp. 2012CJ34-2]MCL6271306.1 hypothetical protein [Sansalvadorimonas sp. 2012CJ34-2]
MEYVRKFLRTLLSHIDLISALHNQYGSLSFSSREFMDLARTIHLNESSDDDNGGELTDLFTRLCQQELLIPVARAENQYDLNPTILDIIELITDQQQLGLSASLKAKIDDLHRLTHLLGNGLAARDSYLVGRYTSQLDRRFRDVHRELQQNEQAIMRIIEDAKNSSRDIPLKTRYSLALDAWNNYVRPAADMLDVQGDYERTLKSIEHQLLDHMEQARHTIGFEGIARLEKLNYRLLDLRSALRRSIDRCSRLLEPIYRRFQQNSSLTRGASIAIAEMRRNKFKYACSPNGVELIGRSRPSLTDSDNSLIAYLSELSVLESPHFDIPEASEDSGPEPVTYSMVEEAALSFLPIQDCLDWLIQQYPQLDTRQLLEFMTRLTNESEILAGEVVAEEARQYETDTHLITMQRRTLARKEAANT